MRPEELTPEQFLDMTIDIYGPATAAPFGGFASDSLSTFNNEAATKNVKDNDAKIGDNLMKSSINGGGTAYEQGEPVWRVSAKRSV